MKRFVVLILIAGTVMCCSSRAARAEDEVRYLDRSTGKEASAAGTIQEENPGEIVLKTGSGGAVRKIASQDVLDVAYDVPGSIKLDYSRVRGLEKKLAEGGIREEARQETLREMLKTYEAMLPRLSDERGRFALRHFEFKMARLLARLAEDDPSQADAAMEALAKFKKSHADSWQIIACTRVLAQMQLDKGDFEAAAKSYSELAAMPDLPKDARWDSDLQVAGILLANKKASEAEKKLQELAATIPRDDPRAERVRIYLAGCLGVGGKLPEAEAQLKSIIDKSTDKTLKALAYNSLGDCYRLNSRPKDALWQYLWVDVIYHQDSREHVKAMSYLAKLFEDQGDKTRAKQYRDRVKQESR